ncbi:MAG: AmmeMemoRadiSam system protein B [Deltaproteobacteria bacterium]|nr:AmmeMemoRadiSam system protein B [Deltaproteobacteria bacterium]
MRNGTVLALVALAALGCRGSSAPASLPADGVIVSRSSGVRFDRNPEKLAGKLDELLTNAGMPAPGNVTALVLPHAAIAYSGQVSAAALAPVRDRRYDRLVLLSPAHPGLASGAVIPKAARAFRTPLGDVPVDAQALEVLSASGAFTRDDGPFLDEHGVDAPLPFLQRAIGAVPLVPVIVGGTDAASARKLAEALRPIVDVHTLVVVSTNLTHHGPRFGNTMFGDQQGADLRNRITQADTILLKPVLDNQLEAFDSVSKSAGSVCGRDALRVLLALLPRSSRGTMRFYDNSFTHEQLERQNQVSYAGIVYDGLWPELPELPQADQAALLGAARKALEAAVAGQASPTPPLGSLSLLQKHGLFVTLYEKGQVRASVGQLQESVPVGRAVVDVATAAATQDAHGKLTAPELADVKIELTLIGAVHTVKDLSTIDPAEDGLFLEAQGHQGLLLPDRGQALSMETVLDALAEKADLPRKSWPPKALSAFATRVIAEPGAQLAPAAAPSDGGN